MQRVVECKVGAVLPTECALVVLRRRELRQPIGVLPERRRREERVAPGRHPASTIRAML